MPIQTRAHFCHAVLEQFSQGLASAGHTNEIVDLYAIKFNPILQPGDYTCWIDETVPMETVDAVLRILGVRDLCDFARVDPFYSASYPGGLRIDAPLGFDAFVDAHAELFPRVRDGFARFLKLCMQIRDDAVSLPAEPRTLDLLTMPLRRPTLARHHKATLADVTCAEIGDPRAAAMLTSLWPYLGLPPSQLSFLYFAMMLMSYLEEGAYYCRGSFQRLVDAIVSALKRQGGELLLNSGATNPRARPSRRRRATFWRG